MRTVCTDVISGGGAHMASGVLRHATQTVEHQHTDGWALDLEATLQQTITGEVRFDSGGRALYATDLSIYRQVPVGVVIPRTIDDVVTTVQACRERGVPILGRGCGTSLAGQCCNVAVVIDFSKYLNRIVALDAGRRTATVQPGVICDTVRQAAEQHHLTLAPDPATHAYCTLGGMIGNNSCGAHTVMGGKTVDNVEALEILTYDGLRMHVGQTSDGELERIISQGGRRGEIYGLLPEGTTWLLVEFGGETPAEASAKARDAMQSVQRSDRECTGLRLLTDAAEQKAIWEIREAGVAASRVPGVEESWPSWEDAAVPPERLGDYLRDFDKLLKKYNYRYTLFGHFGDGCIHCRITFDLETAAGVQQ